MSTSRTMGFQQKGQQIRRSTGLRWLLAAIVLMLTGVETSIGFAQPPLQWAEGRILVQPRIGLTEEEFHKILQRAKGKSKATIGKLNVHIVEVPPQAEQAVVRALSRNPHVKFAEVDALVKPSAFIPNDPVYPNQWHLQAIQAPMAWVATQGNGITVAVLDSGIDATHPDFQGQLVSGWNVVSNNSDTSDNHGHGTAVAGTLGAVTNNATAVAGIAGQGKVMPIRITNGTNLFAYYSDIAKGLNWAADHGAKVANISFGPINSGTVTTAANYFRNKGGVVVVAGGNDGTNPGLKDDPSMIYVSATNKDDERTSWSNYGDYIDIAAPGDWIYTTNRGGGTGAWYGTSFSTPVAAGVVALIMSREQSLTPSEVENVLANSADNLGSSLYYGAGRVNADRAVQLAGETNGGGDTERPVVAILKPSRDAKVNGWVAVDVDAKDNVGVRKVVLYAGGLKVGEDSVSPYQFSWNSTNEPDGPVTLIAYAYDEAGNEGSSGAHPVIVDNVPDIEDTTPPTVDIVDPQDGSTVSGTVQVIVHAADDVSLALVKLYIDGNLVASSNVSPLSYSWNTRKASGSPLLKAVAMDGANLTAEVQIQVTVGSGSKGGPGNKGGGGGKGGNK
jgi:thermitase